jgi:hypothetical protein
MAKISHSDLAPDEAVHYDLAGVEFDLGGSGGSSFETDDRTVLANAQIHPWLTVEYEKEVLIAGRIRSGLSDHPELDPLSDQHPNAKEAFDADAIKAVEESKVEADMSHLAVDANLDQGEEQSVGDERTGEIAVTLAADESHEPAKSAKAFEQDEETAAKAASGQLDPADQVDPTKPESRKGGGKTADKEKN